MNAVKFWGITEGKGDLYFSGSHPLVGDFWVGLWSISFLQHLKNDGKECFRQCWRPLEQRFVGHFFFCVQILHCLSIAPGIKPGLQGVLHLHPALRPSVFPIPGLSCSFPRLECRWSWGSSFFVRFCITGAQSTKCSINESWMNARNSRRHLVCYRT